MFKTLFALLFLPLLGLMLMGGVVAEAASGAVPASPAASPVSPTSPGPRGGSDSLAGRATAALSDRIELAASTSGERGCCDAVGGPDGIDGFDLSRLDPLLAPTDPAARWRLPDDRAAARRFVPPEPRYNSITIPF